MNPDKARDLFSDYREGVLSPNLKASFESTLLSDGVLRREYSQFDELLTEFESSSEQEYEVPFDLHDKIMARLDKSLFEERRKAKSGWFSGRRLGFVGAVACLALVGAVLSINNSSSGPGIASIGPNQEFSGLSVSYQDGNLHLKHGTAVGSSILVKDELSGKLVQKFELDGKALDSFQKNNGDEAVLLRVESNSESLIVAVPGKVRNTVLAGKGTFRDLARIVADTYGEPVQVVATELDAPIVWTLDTSEPVRSKATSGKFSLERRSGMLYLTD